MSESEEIDDETASKIIKEAVLVIQPALAQLLAKGLKLQDYCAVITEDPDIDQEEVEEGDYLHYEVNLLKREPYGEGLKNIDEGASELVLEYLPENTLRVVLNTGPTMIVQDLFLMKKSQKSPSINSKGGSA